MSTPSRSAASSTVSPSWTSNAWLLALIVTRWGIAGGAWPAAMDGVAALSQLKYAFIARAPLGGGNDHGRHARGVDESPGPRRGGHARARARRAQAGCLRERACRVHFDLSLERRDRECARGARADQDAS